MNEHVTAWTWALNGMPVNHMSQLFKTWIHSCKTNHVMKRRCCAMFAQPQKGGQNVQQVLVIRWQYMDGCSKPGTNIPASKFSQTSGNVTLQTSGRISCLVYHFLACLTSNVCLLLMCTLFLCFPVCKDSRLTMIHSSQTRSRWEVMTHLRSLGWG